MLRKWKHTIKGFIMGQVKEKMGVNEYPYEYTIQDSEQCQQSFTDELLRFDRAYNKPKKALKKVIYKLKKV